MGTQMLSTAKEQVESEMLNPSANDIDKTINKLNCRLCSKKFPDIKSLTKHYRTGHGHVCCFFCIYCFTNLKSRDAILNHIHKEHENKELKFKIKFTLPINLDANGNPSTKSPVYVYDEESGDIVVVSEPVTNAPVQAVRSATQNLKAPAQNVKAPVQNQRTSNIKTRGKVAQPLSTLSETRNIERPAPAVSPPRKRKRIAVSSPDYIKPGCCPLCGKEVENSNVISHMKIHFHMFKYQCKYCDFNKVEAYEIKRHILSRHKNKPLAIIEMTDNSNDKEAHMKKYVDWFLTFNQEGSVDKTPATGSAKASRFSAAAEALKSLEPPNYTYQNSHALLLESGRLQCPACSFECVSQDLFNKHKRQHTFTEIIYHCEYCTFKDYSESHVITHIKKFHVDKELYIREVSQIQVMVEEKAGDITYQTVYAEIPNDIKLNPIIKLVDVVSSHPYLMPKDIEDDSEDGNDEMDDDDIIEVKDDEIYEVEEVWKTPRTSQIKVKMEVEEKESEPLDISKNDFNFLIKEEKDEKDEKTTDLTVKQEDVESMQVDSESVENTVEEISLIIKQEMDTF